MPTKKPKRVKKAKKLKTYPSVSQMIAATTSPKFAVKYLADAVADLQGRMRRVELKTAVTVSELKPVSLAQSLKNLFR